MEDKRKKYKIKLHSNLSKYSNEVMEVYANDLRDIFGYLCSRFGEDFKQTILNGAWHILKGNYKDENYILEHEVDLPIMEDEIHVFPAISGAGGNVGRIILGVVLIIIAIIVVIYFPPAAGAAIGTLGKYAISGTAASLALAGVASIAQGVMGMLTKSPKIDVSAGASTDRRESFIFNGAVNNAEQGVPVPRVYGLHLTGSTVISAGIETYRI